MGRLARAMVRFYVTTPIYYVNDAPHIGHAYTTVTGDALCRWHRLLGEDVFYLTGTDEHGLKMLRAAEAAGLTPRELADRNSARFKDAWDLLGIQYDQFIRTTEERHYAAVQQFLQSIYDAGDIELRTYEGLYCVACEGYYTEDEAVPAEGGGEGEFLCPVHGRPLELLQEDNYFFLLSRYEQRLLDWYAEHGDAVYPETRRNEVLGFIRGGLKDISVSRSSFNWGVPLPWDRSHVAWVWFDALPNYITAAGYGSDPAAFEKWWPADYHLVGKDIIRFHAVYWPAMLMSAGLEPPRHVAAHGWLLVGGEKMSKTRLNQIAPADLVGDFGVDGFRYQFLRDVAFGPDGDFSYEGMLHRYNADLANQLGNLFSRVATVVGRKCGGVGPRPQAGSPLQEVAAEAYEAAAAGWARPNPAEALDATWRLVRESNAYLEANEPWKAEPGAEVDAVMGDALEALRIVAVLASPAIPTTCDEIWRRLGLPGRVADQRLPGAAAWGGYPGGLAVEKGEPLFPRKQA
ncbi:MAG TPA: methionine--tRNA ligase [Acidimicrobiales bacterium]|nr:methionine--tRNA ligase [Acidimicrobiales bacterium]